MAVIRVILGGCGIQYKDANGNTRHVLKTPEDKPFECDDKHAENLVRMGFAKYVTPQPVQQPDKIIGHLDGVQLESMTKEQLKNFAAELGVDVSDCKNKADYVAAIEAAEVEIDPESIEEDPDELPDLSAADPE